MQLAYSTAQANWVLLRIVTFSYRTHFFGTVKWVQVLLCKNNNLFSPQSFVYTHLDMICNIELLFPDGYKISIISI